MSETPSRQSSVLSSIDLSRHESWSQTWFLVIDMDWAPDEVLLDTLELIQGSGVTSNWMVTHSTPVLSDLRSARNVELGVHPNFNGLLNGQELRGFSDARAVMNAMVDLVPEAKVVRSHSVAQSGPLMDLWAELGFTHDVNMFIPSGSGNVCGPWRAHNGMTRVPYAWGDNVYCLYEGTDQPEKSPYELLLNRQGIVVVNFHPIHVYLNTERLDRYESLRHVHQDSRELLKHRFKGYGTRDRLMDLLSLATAL